MYMYSIVLQFQLAYFIVLPGILWLNMSYLFVNNSNLLHLWSLRSQVWMESIQTYEIKCL